MAESRWPRDRIFHNLLNIFCSASVFKLTNCCRPDLLELNPLVRNFPTGCVSTLVTAGTNVIVEEFSLDVRPTLWLIDCVTSSLITEAWSAFLKRLKCKTAPVLVVILTQNFSYFVRLSNACYKKNMVL